MSKQETNKPSNNTIEMMGLVIIDYLWRTVDMDSMIPHIQPHIIGTWPWRQDKNQDF